MRPKIYLYNKERDSLLDTTEGTILRLTSLEGTGEPDASISSSRLANADGSYVSGAFVEKRNIVMECEFLPQIEHHRLMAYEIIQTRKPITVFYRTSRVDVYTEGYVESFSVDNFKESKTTGQISILCADPFWYSNAVHTANVSNVQDAFYFPWAIKVSDTAKRMNAEGVPFSIYTDEQIVRLTNAGIEAGVLIRIRFIDDVVNPYIHDDTTGELLKIEHSFTDGDILTINTNIGSKAITYRDKDNRTANYLHYFKSGSTWLQLRHGENRFTVGADTGATGMIVSFTWQDKYLGV